MTRELQFPEPPPPDPDRPLFGPVQDDGSRTAPSSRRRISIDGEPDGEPKPVAPRPLAPRAGPPAGPMPPGPPAGPKPPQFGASSNGQVAGKPATLGRAVTGVVSGEVRTQDQPVWLIGCWVGPILLGLLGLDVLAHRQETGLRPWPLLAAALILLAIAALGLISPPGRQAGPAGAGGRWHLNPLHHRPETCFTLRSPNGVDTECRLAGVPDSALPGGATVRCSGRRPVRSGPVRLRRLDLLAGPDGPPIRTIEAVLPPLARVVLWVDRLGWLIAAGATLELIHLMSP